MTRISGSVPDARSTTRPSRPSSASTVPDDLPDGVGVAQAGAVGAHRDQALRELRHQARRVGEALAGVRERGQQQRRRQQAVTRGGVRERDHVARLLAAQLGAVAAHGLEHVAVADVGHDRRAAHRLERPLQAEVGHRREHDAGCPGRRVGARAGRAPGSRGCGRRRRCCRPHRRRAGGRRRRRRRGRGRSRPRRPWRRRARGGSTRQRTLMLTPFGAAPIRSCRTPSRSSSRPASADAAPLAQSTATRRPERSRSTTDAT